MSGKRTEATKNGRVAHFVTQSGQRAAQRLDALTGCFWPLACNPAAWYNFGRFFGTSRNGKSNTRTATNKNILRLALSVYPSRGMFDPITQGVLHGSRTP